ncbi:MAG: ABC transporter permease, partial [Actinomycetota bacterium]|nr:ABC transporter permease [Actinomycetota bacterium]
GVAGDGGGPLIELAEQLPEASFEVTVDRLDLDLARERLFSGELDVVLLDGSTLVWQEEVDADLRNLFEVLTVRAHTAALEVPPASPLADEIVDPVDEDERAIGIGVAMVGVIGTFVLIQTWGSLVAMGVIEEKSTRVIEVLLSHLTSRQLITGEVLGLGLLAMVQAVIVVLGLIGALLSTDSVDVPTAAWRSVGFLVLSIGGGFAFYLVVFAAVGSQVSRTEDAQQVDLSVGIPLLVGYALGLSSVENPDTLVAVVASYIPFTMPTVMPLRLAGGAMSNWEVGLAFTILFGSTVLVARLAERLYHVSLLHAGSRITWRRALAILQGR